MSHSNQESGHYKNVASFHALVEICTALGDRYKPSRTDLTLLSLNNRLANVDDLMERLSKAQAALGIAIRERSTAFEQLPKFTTRVVNALEQSNPGSPAIGGVRHLVSKIRGKRIVKITPASQTADADNTPAPAHVSASQSSYDAQLDHFAHIVHLLQQEPAYTPNEPDMNIEGLQNMVQILAQRNSHVAELQAQYQVLLTERKHALYGPVSGVLPLVKAIKKYFIMILGTDAQELKAAYALTFKVGK